MLPTLPLDEEQQDHPEVRLSEATLTELDARMKKSVREGITEAMTEEAAEKFWLTGWKVLRKQATMKAGEVAIDGSSGLLRKVGTLLLGAAILYALGGWHLVVSVWKAITTSST